MHDSHRARSHVSCLKVDLPGLCENFGRVPNCQSSRGALGRLTGDFVVAMVIFYQCHRWLMFGSHQDGTPSTADFFSEQCGLKVSCCKLSTKRPASRAVVEKIDVSFVSDAADWHRCLHWRRGFPGGISLWVWRYLGVTIPWLRGIFDQKADVAPVLTWKSLQSNPWIF